MKSDSELRLMADRIRSEMEIGLPDAAVDRLRKLERETMQEVADAVLQHKLHGSDQTAAGFYAAILGPDRDCTPKG